MKIFLIEDLVLCLEQISDYASLWKCRRPSKKALIRRPFSHRASPHPGITWDTTAPPTGFLLDLDNWSGQERELTFLSQGVSVCPSALQDPGRISHLGVSGRPSLNHHAPSLPHQPLRQDISARVLPTLAQGQICFSLAGMFHQHPQFIKSFPFKSNGLN